MARGCKLARQLPDAKAPTFVRKSVVIGLGVCTQANVCGLCCSNCKRDNVQAQVP